MTRQDVTWHMTDREWRGERFGIYLLRAPFVTWDEVRRPGPRGRIWASGTASGAAAAIRPPPPPWWSITGSR